MAKRMNRREFMIKGSSAVIGAGLAANAGPVFGRPDSDIGIGRVVEVAHPGAVLADRVVDPAITRKMLRRGMEALTGSSNPWRKFVSPSDRVGLKINTLGRPLLYTHHELIAAMVAELEDFGVKKNSIIVWDRFETQMRDCRFEFNTSASGVCVYGTDALDENVRRYDPDVAYVSDFDNPDQRQNGSTASRLSSVFTGDCDKVINMAILKDHGLSGVTLKIRPQGISTRYRFPSRSKAGPSMKQSTGSPGLLARPQDDSRSPIRSSSGTRLHTSVSMSFGGG